MNGINISLYSMAFKDHLVNIGKNENERKALIRYLKDLCSDINFLLNGLRSESDFERYSRDYDITQKRWLAYLKEKGIADDPKKMEEYMDIVRKFVSFIEKPST